MAFWMPSVVKFSEWEDVSDMDVSVIIPTYKPQEYIWQCLDTLYQQTLEHRRYELIVVVNGCKEPYYSQILAHVTKWDKDLKVTVLQTDVPGVSHARNMGIERVEGKYVCFVDDDDWVSATYLEGLLSGLIDSEGCIVVSNVKAFEEETSRLLDDYLSKAYNRNKQKVRLNLCRMRSLFSTVWCKAISGDLVVGRRFDESFRIGEDALFMASITNRLKLIRFAPVDAVYYRRVRKESASRGKMPIGFIVQNAWRLWLQYGKLFASDMSHYNVMFFMTRFLAVTKNHVLLIKKTWGEGWL